MDVKVTYSMVANTGPKRSPGRPREFDPDAALDRAVELFWADGFEGVDVARIARAAGVTKPSLYRLFGDKSALFLQALQRYGQTIGAAPLAAFDAQPEIGDAVSTLLEASVRAATTEGRPRGCLMACVAAAQAEGSEDIRAEIARGLGVLADVLERRFEEEMTNGRLSTTTSARARSRLIVDMMQGLSLRARAGALRDDLLGDARSYVTLVLS